MITFTEITIEGFCSIIQPITYKLDRLGVNIITGRNGSGKTLILNAIYWALYGKPIKEASTIEPWEHVKDQEFYRGTKVSIKFLEGDMDGDVYEVIRCKDFKGKVENQTGKNRLVIIKDGKALLELRDKEDQKKWIVQKLGYSVDLFKHAILFGQGVTRLTGEDGPTKKKVFDEAFDTLFINRAREIASKKLDGYSEVVRDLEVKRSTLEVVMEQLQNQITQAESAKREFNQQRAQDIDELAKQLDLIRHKIQKVPDVSKLKEWLRTPEPDGAVEREFRLQLKVHEIASKIEGLKQTLRNSKITYKNLPANCDKCGKELDIKSRKKTLKDLKLKINEVSTQISKESMYLNLWETKHQKAKEAVESEKEGLLKINEYKTRITHANSIQQQNDSIRERIQEKMEQIQKLREKRFKAINIKKLRSRLEKRKKEVEGIILELRSANKKHETYLWLLNDPLANNGLKAFIFDSMLRSLNKACKVYTSRTGFTPKASIDMESAHKNVVISVTEHGREVPYNDLSGGQKQLVDVTIAFALNDVVTKLKPINVLFLDEVFESLDPDNIEKVGQIISDKSKSRSIHLITHQSQYNPKNAHRTELALKAHRTVMI